MIVTRSGFMKIVTRSRFAAENDNVVKLDDSSSVLKQGEGESKTNVTKTISSVSADDFVDVLSFTKSRKGTKKYQNAKDAALNHRDGAWRDDAISKEDSEDVDDEGIVENPVKVNLPKISPNGTGVSTNWIYFTVRQSTTRRRLLPAIYKANGGSWINMWYQSLMALDLGSTRCRVAVHDVLEDPISENDMVRSYLSLLDLILFFISCLLHNIIMPQFGLGPNPIIISTGYGECDLGST
ncbi:hypothetical protein Tco_1202266 [Tanacetum coccineum]